MKPTHRRKLCAAILLAACAFFQSSTIAADAPRQLRSEGVLGNSGEQGASLVRFGPGAGRDGVVGVGVVYDRHGTLWSRGGEGVLNRYTLDGRRIASVKIPSGSRGMNGGDKIALVGDLLVLRLKGAIYTLSTDAKPTDTPTPLKGLVTTAMSSASHEGWLGATDEKSVFMFNPVNGERRLVADLTTQVNGIDVLPNGTVAVADGRRIRLFQIEGGNEVTPADNDIPVPGERMQFLGTHWFGGSWHGTIRRLNATGEADPGVVLGGASGSFIGHLDQNADIVNPRGLTEVRDGMMAISGIAGTVQLMTWLPQQQRYEIGRRIGAVPTCNGIGLDRDGNVWWSAGVWRWDDLPDAPMRYGVTTPDGDGASPVAMIDGQTMVTPLTRGNSFSIAHGPLTTEIEQDRLALPAKSWPQKVAGFAVTRVDKALVALMVDAKGVGRAVRIGSDGKPAADAGELELKSAEPLKTLTSLATLKSGIAAGADGAVVEFKRTGTEWSESRRWSSWGPGEADRFGKQINIAVDGDRLWASDTTRHRVLVFDISGPKPVLVASFGKPDAADDDLTSLSNPKTLAACGDRAVVFDSDNQRLLKLSLDVPVAP